ncbi:MAG TPA: choice-of-anchor tandem repeat GloVer-containing protein [Terriglobales bacterium]|jgi:uncharacterized repeat protein (TIGR03803 family)
MKTLCHPLLLIALTLIWPASPALQAQTYKVIHNFSRSVDGLQPNGLTADAAGNLFGTAEFGGTFGLGTVFKLDSTTHTVTVLHTFAGPPDGNNPTARLVVDSVGNLYGTTKNGGVNGKGTAFKIDASGVETILHNFRGLDGRYPLSSLTPGPAGSMYGTASAGGHPDDGVVFQITASGNERLLHEFAGTDGAQPYGGLAKDSAGNLYGTTYGGGASNHGTVFKLAPDGTQTVLHSFTGGADGDKPEAEPVLDSAGNLYSTTYLGGDSGLGTVFKIDSAGNFSVLHSFSGADGARPSTGLVLDANGNLYGNTLQGGDSNVGVVFKLDPSGNETILHSFAGGTDGARPTGTPLMTPNGTIFGSTSAGGFHYDGTLFRIKP